MCSTHIELKALEARIAALEASRLNTAGILGDLAFLLTHASRIREKAGADIQAIALARVSDLEALSAALARIKELEAQLAAAQAA